MTTQPAASNAPGAGPLLWHPELRSPFWDWYGIKSKMIGPGLVELRMSVRPEMINMGNGSVHGGVVASLIDSAVAAMLSTVYRHGVDITGMTTIDLNVTYLEAVPPGADLVCTGRLVRKGGTICVGEADVRDQDNRLCAVGRATYMVFRKRAPQNPS